MPTCYEQDLRVLHFECDPWDRMTPGAILRRGQQIANDHCESLGLGQDIYQRTGTAFLLAKLSLRVLSRLPRVDEDIKIATRAYGMHRAVYHRYTTIYAQDGQPLCETDGRWLLVDVAARRILRKPLDEFLPYFNEKPDPAEEHPMDIPRPDALFDMGQMRAAYSLCDRNGHVNNAIYADLMCDHLPLERLRETPPSQMVLHYHSEIPLSSGFVLQSAPNGQDGYYFVARRDEGRDFEGYVRF